MSAFIDMTGMRFGKLEVLGLSERKGNRNEKYWTCKCDCGNIKDVIGTSLRGGNTRSCGCLARKSQRETMKETNKKQVDESTQKITSFLDISALSDDEAALVRSLVSMLSAKKQPQEAEPKLTFRCEKESDIKPDTEPKGEVAIEDYFFYLTGENL